MRSWLVFILLPLVGTPALAKRGPAPRIEPLVKAGIRYVIPNDDGRRGYVQAQDVESGKLLWEVTVFTVRVSAGLEEDVQWVFLTQARPEGRGLTLVDERGRSYHLDIDRRTARLVPRKASGPIKKINKN